MSDVHYNQLSNWGRWGSEDQQGTLNLITPELIVKAVGLVKRGKVYSLSMPLEAEGPQWPMRHKTWKVTTHGSTVESGTAFCDDVVMMHSHSGTHIDALCHCWYDSHLYNGFKTPENISSAGVRRNSINNVPAIVGRAVLLDIARWKGVEHLGLGEAVSANDLTECASSQGIEIRTGDILLVRTGWMRVFSQNRVLFDSGEPGIDTTTLPWLKQHEIAGVAADNHGVEVIKQIPPNKLPVHEGAIRDLGMYLMENFNLEALAADKVYECLLVVAPLQLTGGAGSPINPIAIA